jgi:hypothetical protein
MTLEALIIAIVRVAGSLPVLRWAFAGAIIAVLVDFSDLFMMNLLNLGGLSNYQAFDKWLDLVYMATFLVAALRWQGTARNLAIGLFALRIVGVGVFELADWRGVLLFFPNLFEFWVIFVAGLKHYRPTYAMTPMRAALWLTPLLALKEFQEYALHGGRWLDKYRAVDVAADWWDWLRGLF